MAFFNKEDLIKWNDLATSLQDIIMRKITWDMLHPDLQAWLLDKERRIIELERWRRVKADPMLDDHETRITDCESEITDLWDKLGDAEDAIKDLENPPDPGPDPSQDWPGGQGWIKLPPGLIIQWGEINDNQQSNQYQYQSYPIPFPNRPFTIAGVDARAKDTTPAWIAFNIRDMTGASDWPYPAFDYKKEFAYLVIHPGGFGGINGSYIAIGY